MARRAAFSFDIDQQTNVFNRFIEELQSESDRGAASVGCDYLDKMMEALIESKMNSAKTIDTGKQKKNISCKLLKYPGPLSTASSRVDLAHVLGWIGPKTYADLSIIRKVRNKFAHSYEPLRFTDHEVGVLCSELKSLRFAARGRTFAQNRDKFIVAVSFLMLQLHALTGEGEKVGLGPDPEVNAQNPPKPKQP